MVVLAVAGVVALVVAALTGSTPLALVVVALAVAGIIQLLRDWRTERTDLAIDTESPAAVAADHGMSPDEFSPDISTDPDGPSSDARADQP